MQTKESVIKTYYESQDTIEAFFDFKTTKAEREAASSAVAQLDEVASNYAQTSGDTDYKATYDAAYKTAKTIAKNSGEKGKVARDLAHGYALITAVRKLVGEEQRKKVVH